LDKKKIGNLDEQADNMMYKSHVVKRDEK